MADDKDYRNIIIRRAMEMGLDPQLVLRLVNQESAFKTTAVSPKQAYGLFQLMPGTAKELGVDPKDPLQNIEGGLRYFKQQLDRFGDPRIALAAYNAGPGAVQKHGGIPPFKETQNYVSKIMSGYEGTGRYNASPEAMGRMEAGGTGFQSAITGGELGGLTDRTAAETLIDAGEYGDPSLLASEVMRRQDRDSRLDNIMDAVGLMGELNVAEAPVFDSFLTPGVRRGRAGMGDAGVSRFRDPVTGRGLASLGLPGFATRMRR